MRMSKRSSYGLFLLACIGLGLASLGCASQELHWYKGNTHGHSWWSDGSSPPEVVVAWYKEHGYNFQCISDHNVLKDHEKWYTKQNTRGKRAAWHKEGLKYEKQFGDDWVEKRVVDGKTEYRLKTLCELKKRYEEPGRFLLIPGLEFGAPCENRTLHINAINIKERVPAQSGSNPSEIIENNIAKAKAQEAKYNRLCWYTSITPTSPTDLRLKICIR